MRAVFSILGLLLVVAVVGLLARQQLGAVSGAAAGAEQGTAAQPGPAAVAAPAAPAQQVQQVKDAVEQQLQAPRPMPDDTK